MLLLLSRPPGLTPLEHQPHPAFNSSGSKLHDSLLHSQVFCTGDYQTGEAKRSHRNVKDVICRPASSCQGSSRKKKHTSKSPSGSRCSVLSQPPGGRGCCREPREHGSFLLQRSRRTPTTPNGPTSPRSIKLPPCLLALFLHFFFCSVKLWHCQACYHLWLKIFTVGSANSCHDEQTLHTALVLANTLHLFYYYYF